MLWESVYLVYIVLHRHGRDCTELTYIRVYARTWCKTTTTNIGKEEEEGILLVTLLGLQFRVGDKPVKFYVFCTNRAGQSHFTPCSFVKIHVIPYYMLPRYGLRFVKHGLNLSRGTTMTNLYPGPR